MKNESNKIRVLKSVSAVQEYITLTTNSQRHEAYILINTNGKESNPEVKMVSVEITDNIGKIIVENLNRVVCSNEFTTQNSSISLYNKTLHIESKDMFSNRIVIEITAV